ncbi:MAG TPA: hypothetical protein VIW23_13855 [Candidatus Acidoferrum sp.]|jgi:ketosteroid isomerase-like protein
MEIDGNCRNIASAIAVVLLAYAGVAGSSPKHQTPTGDRIAIERLHRLDVEATLTDSADELSKLWDKDAVRLQPGQPPEVTKIVIYSDDKRWETSSERPKTLCYKTEIHDLQISGDWAFEWGYFSYRNSRDATAGRGKTLRVMKRQSDSSWKFARVIGFPEKNESAAPMSQPCK